MKNLKSTSSAKCDFKYNGTMSVFQICILLFLRCYVVWSPEALLRVSINQVTQRNIGATGVLDSSFCSEQVVGFVYCNIYSFLLKLTAENWMLGSPSISIWMKLSTEADLRIRDFTSSLIAAIIVSSVLTLYKSPNLSLSCKLSAS